MRPLNYDDRGAIGMDVLSFIASLVKSLAWPGVVLVLLYFLRPHIRGLVERRDEISLPGGTRAKFSKEMDEARDQRELIVLSDGEPPRPDPAELRLAGIERYVALANLSPEGAV